MTLQLEVGRSYIRRDGKTAIARYLIKDNILYPWVVEHDGRDSLYNEKGELWVGCRNDADLIRPAEVSEPCVIHEFTMDGKCMKCGFVEPAGLRLEAGKMYTDTLGSKWTVKHVTGNDYVAEFHSTCKGKLRRAYHASGKAKGDWPDLVREVPPEPSPSPVSSPAGPVIDGLGEYVNEYGAKAVVKAIRDGIAYGYVETTCCQWSVHDGKDHRSVNSHGIVGRWKEPKPARRCDKCGSLVAAEKERCFPCMCMHGKPEPPPVPWSCPEDVPMPVCWVRGPNGFPNLVLAVNDSGVVLHGAKLLPFDDMPKGFQYSVDGREWRPCNKPANGEEGASTKRGGQE